MFWLIYSYLCQIHWNLGATAFWGNNICILGKYSSMWGLWDILGKYSGIGGNTMVFRTNTVVYWPNTVLFQFPMSVFHCVKITFCIFACFVVLVKGTFLWKRNLAIWRIKNRYLGIILNHLCCIHFLPFVNCAKNAF